MVGAVDESSLNKDAGLEEGDILLSLNDSSRGKSVLKSAGLTGILSVNDKDYDEHRAIIKRVLDEDYTK